MGGRMKPDILDRLHSALTMRPGTADSDVNVLALPVDVPYGDVSDAISEIQKLRADIILMRSITGKALDGGVASLSEIKKEIRNVK
jgi:hypothetical protein